MPVVRIVAACFICLALVIFGSGSAEARTHHHKHHYYKHHHVQHAHHTHHVIHHAAKAKLPVLQDVRTAQKHLIHLGYLSGKADGKLGPKTVSALRHFQKDHHLAINGKLNTSTYNALVEADMPAGTKPMAMPVVPPVAASDFYAKHPDFYGQYDQQYADPMITAPTVVSKDNSIATERAQNIPSRFGQIEVTEANKGIDRRYNVTLNGQSILMVDDQPSVIGISSTYNMGDEDAIILTAYHDTSTICPYKHYLLTLRQDGNNMQEISNCTRGYQARLTNGSLIVEFPESDDRRVVGNTWRYEGGRLERL